jgi:hypothetical protein
MMDFRYLNSHPAFGLIAVTVVLIVVLVKGAARLHIKGRAATVMLSALAVGFMGWAVVVHHYGAPADPYPGAGDNCPGTSSYVSAWYPGTKWAVADGGVVHWAGSTELASCGSTLTAGVG